MGLTTTSDDGFLSISSNIWYVRDLGSSVLALKHQQYVDLQADFDAFVSETQVKLERSRKNDFSQSKESETKA